MGIVYIVTGAAGHLGGTIVRTLTQAGANIRALIMPGEEAPAGDNVKTFCGDVTDKESLEHLFDCGGDEAVVIHAAGIVSIDDSVSDKLRKVNVGGTDNIISLCRSGGGCDGVKRLVYVSSVHAIPENRGLVTSETDVFSPDLVKGGYAKTKAQATANVLRAAGEGLDAVVVHPSGIIGPYDRGGNHLVQLISDYLRGRLPACVKGGYDFVDVRDVAEGCIRAAVSGVKGRCYILSNKYFEISEIIDMVRKVAGGRHIPALPAAAAMAALPFIRAGARLTHKRPLFTGYSIYTISSDSRFSHERATAELGYSPRGMNSTIWDTVRWLRGEDICLT